MEGADDACKINGSSADSSADSFLRKVDDGEKPGDVYASPDDELKAIYLAKAGEPVTIAVLDAIRSNLELHQVSMSDLVAEVRKHAGNAWHNPPGFLRDLSKRFRAKTQPATPPVTAAETEEKNYCCQRCKSRVRGEGALLSDGKVVPCSCATEEYISRERARGVFAEETPQ